MADVRTTQVRLTLETSSYIRSAKEAEKATENLAKSAESSVMKADAALEGLGNKAGMLGTIAAGGLALFGKAAMDWESAFAGVEKTVDGTSAQMQQLEGDLLGLARTMPSTHAEIAAVASAAGALGVATDDVTDFTRTMIMLGEATDDLTADEAATQIAQISNVMQTAADDTDNFASTLVKLGNEGASTEGQILALASRVAGVGSTIGATEQEVLALSAAMANLGIPAELGGGGVQRVLTKINSAVHSGSEALTEYAEVAGVSAEEFSRVWRESPVEAFDLVIQGLGRVRESGGDVTQVLHDMGIKGTQNEQVMLRLAGAGDGLTKALEMANKEWSVSTALADEYGKRWETTAAQVQMAWNSVKGAAIDGGEALLPVIKTGAAVVGSLADAFAAIPDPVQNAMVATAGFTTVAGLGFAGFVKLRGAIASTRAEMAALGLQSKKTPAFAAMRNDLETLASGWATAGARSQREQARMAEAAKSLRTNIAGVAKATAPTAAALAGMGLAASGLADKVGATNTVMLASAGLMMGGPWGLAIGGGIGALLDFAGGQEKAARDTTGLTESLDRQTGALTENSAAWIATELGSARAEFEALGISANEVTAAIMEGGPAVEDLLTRLDQLDGNDPFDGMRTQIPMLQMLVAGLADDVFEAQGEFNEIKTAATEAGTGISAGMQIGMESVAGFTEALLDNVDAMRAQREEALRALDADLNYIQSLNDAKKAMKSVEDGGRGLAGALKGVNDITDVSTEQQVEGMRVLRQVAGAWNALSDEAQNTPGAFKAARKAFLDTAADMGMPEQAAKDLAREILNIPEKRQTKIALEGDEDAKRRIRDLNTELSRVDWNRTIRISYSVPSKPRILGPGMIPGEADGGFVPKTGLPYADRHLYLLADGEGVTTNRNGETDRFRDVISGINAGLSRAQVKGMLADGGFSGGSIAGSSFTTFGIGNAVSAQRDLSKQLAATAGVVSMFGAGLSKEMDKVDRSLKGLRKQLKANEKVLEKARERRDERRAVRDSLADSLQSRYALNLFDTPENIWAPGATMDPTAAVKASNREWRQLNRARKSLSGLGLDKGALDALLDQGSLADIQGLAATWSKRDAREFQRLYNRNQKLASNVSSGAADAAWGAWVKQAEKQFKAERADVKRIEKRLAAIEKNTKDGPKKTGQAVNSAKRGQAARAGRNAR